MATYFRDFFSGLGDFSPMAWLVVGVLALLGVGLWLMLKKNAGKTATLVFALGTLLAFVLLLCINLPTADLGDDVATDAGGFLYNPWFLTALMCLMMVLVGSSSLAGKRFTPQTLTAAALCIAASFALSCLKLYSMPMGGSITPASMLPIFILCLLYGPTVGMAAGVALGILQLMQVAYVVHPFQFLLDYILPFGALGMCGFFRRKPNALGKRITPPWLWMTGIGVACLARLTMHVVSGVLFWGMYAPEGTPVLWYSLSYNGGYMLVETALCLALAALPPLRKFLNSLVPVG